MTVPHNLNGDAIRSDRAYWRGCVGKRRFTSRKSAKGGIRTLIKARGPQTRDSLIQPYKCTGCRGWHFGHSPLEKPGSAAAVPES